MKNLLDKLSTLLFYSCIFVFIVALAFPHNPAGNWYQQFMPSTGNRPITDITFTDSLNGYAIANRLTLQDTSFILKTTNSGDNWFFSYADSGVTYNRIQFINQNTGYVGGTHLIKTTDGGNTWNMSSPLLFIEDFHFISIDTGWFVKSNSLTGGVFRTTNGGTSWIQQLSLGSQNPIKVYFFNGSTGYIGRNTATPYVRKTTDGGASWTVNVAGEGFNDIYFIDSNTGWRAWSNNMYKTTNGGLNWVTQVLPYGGMIITTTIEEFTNINKDTIWGVGGWVQYPNFQSRGKLYHTTNGGDTWRFQVPDTSINIFRYVNNKFINKLVGWAYSGPRGIHTTNGGDTTFYLPVQLISNEIPKEYKLFNNYPNPFNPITKIKYQITGSNRVSVKVFDITGREVAILLNEEQRAGIYEVDFNGSNFSSGVYFYSLIVDGANIDTKKMVLVK